MKQINIFGENRLRKFTKIRIACRGIVVENEKILVSQYEKINFLLIPGGGVDPGETLEDCVKRELVEETSYIVADRTFSHHNGLTLTIS